MASETKVVHGTLLEYFCPNCNAVNQTYGKSDFVTCRKCRINQLTYVLRDAGKLTEVVEVVAPEAEAK